MSVNSDDFNLRAALDDGNCVDVILIDQDFVVNVIVMGLTLDVGVERWEAPFSVPDVLNANFEFIGSDAG